MADDIQVKNSDIVLRNLYKAQHIQEKATAEFSVFFENCWCGNDKSRGKLAREFIFER